MSTTQRPTPETDAAIRKTWPADAAALAIKLERERDEALAKLSTVYRWIERNHPDGFIDSQSHLQNLDRVADAWHDKLEAMREAIKDAHYALAYVYNHGEGSCTFPYRTEDDLCSENRFHHVKDALDALKPFLP